MQQAIPTAAEIEAMRTIEYVPPQAVDQQIEKIESEIQQTAKEVAALVGDAVPPEPPKARTCQITDHFGLNFVELMRQAPNNPLTRAHMLKVLKQMPPPEADKFFKLVDWVEFNFPSRLAQSKPKSTSTATFALEFSVSRNDRGRANYRINRSGTWTQSYNMDELREWIDGNEDSFDDLDTKFYEKARENESCDLEDSGPYEYSNHEDTDSDGTEMDMRGDSDERYDDLLNFLRANGGEDLAQMLEDRQ